MLRQGRSRWWCGHLIMKKEVWIRAPTFSGLKRIVNTRVHTCSALQTSKCKLHLILALDPLARNI